MISLCITTFQRTELLYESFREASDHPFVSEIVIVDDCSPIELFNQVARYCADFPKVKLFRNPFNIDCYFNKLEAITKSSNEWVIIGDSDNKFGRDYFDRLEQLWLSGLNPKTVYQPTFAKPHFNFEQFEGALIDKGNVGKYMVNGIFSTALNAMNYFVNREEYIRVWDKQINPVTSDSIYQNLNWLKAGNNIYFVPGLQYEHNVSNHGNEEGSHYAKNVRRTERGLHQRIENELKEMK